MIVVVNKYKRHAEYLAMDQEKFCGQRNVFVNAVLFAEDT
jgi:hypothetical protein